MAVFIGDASGIKALETPNGQLLKVSPEAEHTDFKRAMDQGDSQTAAAAVLGLVAAMDGVDRTPRALLARHAQVSRCIRVVYRNLCRWA